MGIDLPEPSEIELLGENARDPLTVLRAYLERKGKRPAPESAEILRTALSGVECSINRDMGTERYRNEIKQAISGLSQGTEAFCLNTRTGNYRQQDALKQGMKALESILTAEVVKRKGERM